MDESLSDAIGQLSIDVDALARKAEALGSDASYRGIEDNVEDLLAVGAQLRGIASELEGMR